MSCFFHFCTWSSSSADCKQSLRILFYSLSLSLYIYTSSEARQRRASLVWRSFDSSSCPYTNNTILGICSRNKLSGSLAWANHSTCIFFCSLFVHNGPPRCLCVPESASVSSCHWTAFFYTQQRVLNLVLAIRICKKNMASISVRVGICAALAVTSRLPPTPLWYSVRRPVIRPSFASTADTLREEFANKGWRLYKKYQ